MANRYWVGGNGIWDRSTTTTNWSTSSGGAGGASTPFTSDNAIFDANSGGGTVTVNGQPIVINITMTGFTGVFFCSGSAKVFFHGSLTLPSSSTTGLAADSGGTHDLVGTATITSNGSSLKSLEFSVARNDGTRVLSLADDLLITGTLSFSVGGFTDLDSIPFNTNNFNITASAFSYSTTQAVTIKMLMLLY